MTDLLGSGETRVYFVDSVRDPSAPTAEELASGTELGEVLASDVDLVEFEDVSPLLFPSTTRYLTVTFEQVRFSRRTVRRIQRAIERRLRDPRRAAIRADYARRRKARQRRR